jgi:hypothetical protein
LISEKQTHTISTLQTDDITIDFPDTPIIIAIDRNNNILNNGDTTSSTLLKLEFVGHVDLIGSSQIIFVDFFKYPLKAITQYNSLRCVLYQLQFISNFL